MSAKEDLVWFGQRLQSILDMIPVLEKVEDLDNWILGKQSTLDRLTTQLNKTTTTLSERQKDLASTVETIKSQWAEHQAKVEALYEAHSARVNAEWEEEKKMKALRMADFQVIVDAKLAEIKTLEAKITQLKADVAEQEQRYLNITAKIQALKEQI